MVCAAQGAPQLSSGRRRTAFYGSALVLLLLGCGGGTTIDDSCFVDLAPISSRTTALSVGDTVTFTAHLGPAECLPAGIDTEEWRWSSINPTIVRIDSLTGLAEGLSAGDALIAVRHARNSGVASNTSVEVFAN